MSKALFKNYISDDGVTMLLYGDIDEWSVSAENVVKELSELEKTGKKITIRINSCGGSVFEGIAIYNAIKNSPADITIMVDGIAASMASVIALCGKPVYLSKYAQLMMHCVSSSVRGNTREVERLLDVMRKLEETIVKMYAAKTGMTEDKVREMWMDGNDHWMSANEALEIGIIDGIYDSEQPSGIDPGNHDALFKYVTNKLITNQNNREMIEKLKQMAQFANCADEEAIITRLTELCNKAEECDRLRKELDNRIKKEKEQKVEILLADAVAKHKLTQAAADSLKTAYANNEEGLKALLATFPEKKKVTIVDDGNPEAWTNKAWDELDKEGRLSELKAKYPDLYQAKFEEKFKH